MDKPETIPTDGQSPVETQPQKRTWITPALEQVELKVALAGGFGLDLTDLGTQSS